MVRMLPLDMYHVSMTAEEERAPVSSLLKVTSLGLNSVTGQALDHSEQADYFRGRGLHDHVVIHLSSHLFS